MKKIVVACGVGVATSTQVAFKIAELLNENGFKDQYNIVHCAIKDAPELCKDADLLVANVKVPEGVTCDFISGLPFLTGVGKATCEQTILDLMTK